jgi:hypothetical protein
LTEEELRARNRLGKPIPFSDEQIEKFAGLRVTTPFGVVGAPLDVAGSGNFLGDKNVFGFSNFSALLDFIATLDKEIARRLTFEEVQKVSDALQSQTAIAPQSTNVGNIFTNIVQDRLRTIIETLSGPEQADLFVQLSGREGEIDQSVEAFSKFLEQLDIYNKGIVELSQIPIPQAALALDRLNEVMGVTSEAATELGFDFTKVQEAFNEGVRVLEASFLIDLEGQIFQIENSFIATLENIRGATLDLQRNADALGVGMEEVLLVNALQVEAALEQALRPVQGVIDSIQIDRAAPLETLEILEARFESARAGMDPAALAQAAQDLLAATQNTFGRTDTFFERSAFVEVSLLAFNEQLRAQAQIQIDLVQRQLIAIETGNETTAQLLEGILETLRGMRADNEELFDGIDLANAKKVA